MTPAERVLAALPPVGTSVLWVALVRNVEGLAPTVASAAVLELVLAEQAHTIATVAGLRVARGPKPTAPGGR